MHKQMIYGWFEDADQTTPSYDPPHDAPCLFCGRQIHPSDVRTHSLMFASVYGPRSYFYRTHRTCAEADETLISKDGIVLDMIARNGD